MKIPNFVNGYLTYDFVVAGSDIIELKVNIITNSISVFKEFVVVQRKWAQEMTQKCIEHKERIIFLEKKLENKQNAARLLLEKEKEKRFALEQQVRSSTFIKL